MEHCLKQMRGFWAMLYAILRSSNIHHLFYLAVDLPREHQAPNMEAAHSKLTQVPLVKRTRRKTGKSRQGCSRCKSRRVSYRVGAESFTQSFDPSRSSAMKTAQVVEIAQELDALVPGSNTNFGGQKSTSGSRQRY